MASPLPSSRLIYFGTQCCRVSLFYYNDNQWHPSLFVSCLTDCMQPVSPSREEESPTRYGMGHAVCASRGAMALAGLAVPLTTQEHSAQHHTPCQTDQSAIQQQRQALPSA